MDIIRNSTFTGGLAIVFLIFIMILALWIIVLVKKARLVPKGPEADTEFNIAQTEAVTANEIRDISNRPYKTLFIPKDAVPHDPYRYRWDEFPEDSDKTKVDGDAKLEDFDIDFNKVAFLREKNPIAFTTPHTFVTADSPEVKKAVVEMYERMQLDDFYKPNTYHWYDFPDDDHRHRYLWDGREAMVALSGRIELYRFRCDDCQKEVSIEAKDFWGAK